MSQGRIAVVTGSNKGIGFAIVRGLCKQFNGDVFLTARDETRGREAVGKLETEGLRPKFHQLDIDDKESVQRLATFISQNYSGLDVLVNNAGMAYKNDSPAPFTEQAEVTLKTNYWGTLNVCNALYPLLRPHARVVHVSSFVSKMALDKCSDSLKSELRACKTVDDVTKYMTKFIEDVKAGTHSQLGWPNTAYGVSKLGVSLMTPIQQRVIDADKTRPDIVINACCPGYVDTDMTSHKGHKTVDQGADTPVYLALLAADVTEPRGEFVSDRKVQPLF
jgi:carbonyl reductase 1